MFEPSSYEISDDVKRDVLARTDLVSLIGAVTTLKKMGGSWKGLCPFHGEKSPSFYVHPAKGFYYCFGCGAKGDAITFVRETERLDFVEAVAYLARLSGVTLPERRSGTRASRREGPGQDAVAAAALYFQALLQRHPAAKEFLEGRGVSLDDAAGLGFGAAADSWDALKTELSGRFKEEVLLEAGLLQKSPETGRVYDRFRNRLTIEIRDPRGEVVGFGARALKEGDNPKYLNSPESNRFAKGKLLFGLDRAREAIRRTNSIILVEGYFDQIAMTRAGASQAVASMGTALTAAQADLLTRQAPTVVIAYDGDLAGQAAFLKAATLLLERGVEVRHADLPEGEDPDSVLAKRGARALGLIVEEASPLLTTLVRRTPQPGADPESRAARIREAAEILSVAPDRVLRHEFLAGLSQATGVPLGTLVRPGKKTSAETVSPEAGDHEDGGILNAEQKVLSVMIQEWPESRPLVDKMPIALFSSPVAREVLAALRDQNSRDTLDFSELASHLGGAAGRMVFRLLLLKEPDSQERRDPDLPDGGLEGLHKNLLQLKIRQLEEKQLHLQSEIDIAIERGDTIRLDQLYDEKRRLSPEVRRLKQELREERKPQV